MRGEERRGEGRRAEQSRAAGRKREVKLFAMLIRFFPL
jgi:hypothetical protein